MANIKFLVLDVLKLHKPNIIDFADKIARCQKGISINVRVEEVDEKTESIRLLIKGARIDYKKIQQTIENEGGSIHSIDEICLGEEMICSSLS